LCTSGYRRKARPSLADPLVSTSVSRRDGWVVVTVQGEIDLSNIDLLRRDISAAVDGAPSAIDLSGVTYIDSQGLHLLHQLASQEGRSELVFVAPEASIAAELLRITNLSDVVAVRTQLPPAFQP